MQVGTLLNNRYRIDATLGEGGMGVVYKAHDTLLDRPVAIKSLSPHLFSAGGLKRLLREAQSAAKLASPGIVAIHDVIEDGDSRFIVMEFVEGLTLREKIPMPWREAAALMRPVFEAMEFAHSRGIIHRDLKPENIIVTPDGTPKIMDFGLARSEGRSRLTQTGLVVGTALYMAPEQALQGKSVPQSDLYALGCVFYELITGRPPFSGEDSLSIITQHINLAPRTPRQDVLDLPLALEELILKLLAKDPTERPRSAGDVARMLSLVQAPGTHIDTPLPARSILSTRVRRTKLVGRTEHLSRILERLDSLMTGTGGMMVISGEPGIGKTRLVDEVVIAARMRGYHTLIGRCHERNIAIPYLPISEALESLARATPTEEWQRLLQAAGPEIHQMLADTPLKHYFKGESAVIPETTAAVLALGMDTRPTRAIRNLLFEWARDKPALLVIDDLHWADPPTLDVLHHLTLAIREAAVLIVGTYREVELERTHPLSQLLVDLNRQRLLVRERVRRFTQAETADLLTGLLGDSLPEGLTEMIHDQTDGNPFFIEEMTSSLIEENRLLWNHKSSRYELPRGLSVDRLAGEVPQGVKAAIGVRLDRLDPQTQQVLTLASVIGRHFSHEMLSRLAAAHGITGDQVERALREAQLAHFIIPLEKEGGSAEMVAGFTAGSAEVEADHAFDHALIHQVVYGELDRRRRRRLHAEVGHLLIDLHSGHETLHAEQLAYHFLESDDDALAVAYSLRAGDKVMRTYYDADIALGYYLPALEMTVAREPTLRHLGTRTPVPLRRGAVHRFTAEEREATVSYLGEVLQAVRGTSAAKAVAALGSRICMMAMHHGEVYQAAMRLYEEALLGPDAQKLVVDTPRGKLVGILEFPGPGGPHPVVMLFHGAPSSKEIFADEVARYHRRGMATLRVDLVGFGETTVPITATVEDATILTEMISAVLAHERVDGRGVGIVGWSWGSWPGAQLAARDDRVRAFVSISGNLDPTDPRPSVPLPEALGRAWRESSYKAGKRPTAGDLAWPENASVFKVAHQIKCPVLLVYGALEPERFRAHSEELAKLVPTARLMPWRSGVHVLRNIPEAHDQAANWLRDQFGDAPNRPA
jgi:pimeloyl-ACP methyl ester carboxylesterase/predicted Ser/Thr protein kinase